MYQDTITYVYLINNCKINRIAKDNHKVEMKLRKVNGVKCSWI